MLLARLYVERLGRPDDGAALYRTVLEEYPRHPGSAEAAWMLGRHELNRGDAARARLYLLRVVFDFTGSPYEADARIALAAAYEALGDARAAQEAYGGFLIRHGGDARAADVRRRLDALAAGGEPLPSSSELLAGRTTRPEGREPTPPRPPRTNEEARRMDDAPPQVAIGPPARPGARAEMASWTASPTFGHNPRVLLLGEGNGLFGGEELEASLRTDGALLDDALLSLGLLYFQMGDYARAGACLERLAQMGVEHSEAFVALAISAIKVGKPDSARDPLSKSVRMEGVNFNRLLSYAQSRLEEGDAATARALLNFMLGLVPDRDEEVRRALEQAQPASGG
jgi:Flp pilus assembly protein TadD